MLRVSRVVAHAWLLGVLLASVIPSARSQTGTASVHGVVVDPSKAAVSGARVTLWSEAQSFERSVFTTESGQYEFLSLAPGTYTLGGELPGFRKIEQHKLELLVNSPVTMNFTLEMGSSDQIVEVSADAVRLNTTDASIGVAFNEQQVKELPLEGRNVPDLLSLQPGVV